MCLVKILSNAMRFPVPNSFCAIDSKQTSKEKFQEEQRSSKSKKKKSFKDSPSKLVRFLKKMLLERNIKRINIKGRTKGNRDK